MKTAILSILTAGALTLTPIAVKPAQAADPHDIIGGILGIAILGAIASDLNDDRATSRSTQRYTPLNANRVNNNGVRHQNYKQRRANRNVLPGECLRVLDGRNNRIVFPERCLARQGISANQLPNQCERRINTRRGQLDVYGASCLADRGWRLPRIARR